MMVLEKRLCPSTKISYTVSCNISLYRDTKEVIYRYTQNVYRCISNSCTCSYRATVGFLYSNTSAFCRFNHSVLTANLNLTIA